MSTNKPRQEFEFGTGRPDPAVLAHLGVPGQNLDAPGYAEKRDVYDRLTKQRNMTATQRRKAKLDAKRVRAIYDIPPDLRDYVSRQAEQVGVPASQMAAYLMIAGIRALSKLGESVAPLVTKISRSARFERVIVLPDFEDEKK